MNDLSGHTALFVGGTSGIGRASAALYHARGGAVVLAGRSAARLETALDGFGDRARTWGLVLDVTDEVSIAKAFEALAPDSVDHLVITAANLTHGPFAEQPVAQVQAMFESKFWGAYRVAKAALPLMRDGGAIVFVSGVLSRRPGVNCAALGAACAALEALARSLALELGPHLGKGTPSRFTFLRESLSRRPRMNGWSNPNHLGETGAVFRRKTARVGQSVKRPFRASIAPLRLIRIIRQRPQKVYPSS